MTTRAKALIGLAVVMVVLSIAAALIRVPSMLILPGGLLAALLVADLYASRRSGGSS